MYIDIGIVGVILLIGWTVKYFVEQRRQRKAEEERKKEVEKYYAEESEKVKKMVEEDLGGRQPLRESLFEDHFVPGLDRRRLDFGSRVAFVAGIYDGRQLGQVLAACR